jgi:hypothetical protein
MLGVCSATSRFIAIASGCLVFCPVIAAALEKVFDRRCRRR